MLLWPYRSLTIYFELSTYDPHWPRWNKERVIWVEEHIRYDLHFDGYYVSIRRMRRSLTGPCTSGFRWKLVIRTAI